MRTLLDFQNRTVEDDGFGNENAGPYATVFSAAAELIPRLGGESVIASRLTGTQPYTIRIRSWADSRQVTPAWRAIDARNPSRVFNIRTIVDADGKNAWLDMLVDDGVAT
jgi:head-tail adaptor